MSPEEMQQLIDTLNQKTAAYDVQVAELQQQVVELQGQLATVTEQATAQITSIRQAATEQIAASMEQIQRTIALYNAQNQYVIALEAQAPANVAAAIKSHQAALDAIQLATLQQRIQSTQP